MGEIIFKTELIKGAKGDRGEAGQADSIPTDGVIAFQGETVPDGYEETDPGDVFDEVYEDINAVKDMISDEYDATAAYNAGDFCIHENALYKCTATTTGLWDSSKWVLTSASDKIKTNAAAIEATQDMVSDAYDPTRTYNVGNYCIYENAFYKCNTANTTGAWDSSKWNVVTIANEFTIVNDELKTVDDYGYGDTIRFSNNDLVVYGFASQNAFIRFFVPVNIKKNIPQNHIHITNIPTSWAVHCANGTVILTNISVQALYRSASGVTINITFDANNSINDLPVIFLLTGFELSIYN